VIHGNESCHFSRTDPFTIEDLKDFYEQEKALYEAVSKMAKNAADCKPWCGGIASPMAYYCKCVADNFRNVEDVASCLCVTIPDDKDCKDRIRAKFGIGLQFADNILQAKEYADNVKQLQEEVEDVQKQLDKLKSARQ
jgi:hypothetical protein